MSSLRNAVKRITHKERSQPKKRQHLGILEKKQDYQKRAQDAHNKDDRIRVMKEKASMRNPDEFYFGMNTSQVKNGQHKSKKMEDQRQLPPEMIQLMKDQDLRYVRAQKQKDAKKAERLQASLHLMDDDGNRKHTIFVDSTEQAEEFDVAEHFDTLPALAGRSFNRLRSKDVEKMVQASRRVDEYGDVIQPTQQELEKQGIQERKLARKMAKARSSAYTELEARTERADKMQLAVDHLETEKLMAGKGRKRKIKAAEDGKPAQYKWRRRRLG